MKDSYDDLFSSTSDMSNKNCSRKRNNRCIAIIMCVILALSFFFFGFVSSSILKSEETLVAEWVTKKVNNYAYFAKEKVNVADLLKNGLSATLNDPYASIATPSETKAYQDSVIGRKLSVGMNVAEYLSMTGCYIQSVVGGSSADKAGVKPNMRFVSINGVDVWEAKIADVTAVLSPIENNVEINIVFAIPIYDDAIEAYDYSKTNTIEVIVSRTQYVEQTVMYSDNDSDEFKNILDADTAYIKISSFVGATGSQFDDAMKTFKNKQKHTLILDLRDNGGGSDINLKSVASHLVYDEGKNNVLVITEKLKDGSERKTITDNNYYNGYDFNKVIILVNGNTASASEALLCAMIDYKTVDLVIGETTYGKGTGIQTHFMPFYNYAVSFTSSYFFSPLGNSHEKVGISPTAGYVVSPNLGNFPFEQKNDYQFMRAVNSLK